MSEELEGRKLVVKVGGYNTMIDVSQNEVSIIQVSLIEKADGRVIATDAIAVKVSGDELKILM